MRRHPAASPMLRAGGRSGAEMDGTIGVAAFALIGWLVVRRRPITEVCRVDAHDTSST